MSGEFKVMHFTSSNLLCDFRNRNTCYFLFKIFHMKNMGQVDPTHNPMVVVDLCLFRQALCQQEAPQNSPPLL